MDAQRPDAHVAGRNAALGNQKSGTDRQLSHHRGQGLRYPYAEIQIALCVVLPRPQDPAAGVDYRRFPAPYRALRFHQYAIPLFLQTAGCKGALRVKADGA